MELSIVLILTFFLNIGCSDPFVSESGQTEGGQTEGGQTEGGQTEGGQTEGGQTEGGQTEGGQTEGGSTGSYNVPPKIELKGVWKSGYSSLKTNEGKLNISFTVDDEDVATLSYEFQLSGDDGISWSIISNSDLSSVTRESALWDASAVTDGIRYRLRARARDKYGVFSEFDESIDSFGLTAFSYNLNDIRSMLTTGSNLYCGNGSCHNSGPLSFNFNSMSSWNAHAAELKQKLWVDKSMPVGPFNKTFHDHSGNPHYRDKMKIMLFLWQSNILP